jgi:hypothetical protein
MLLDSFFILLVVIVSLIILSSSGLFILKKFDKENNLLFINPVVIGTSFFCIIIYFFYYVFKLNLIFSISVTLFFLLLISIISIKSFFKSNLQIIIDNIIIIFPSLIFFFLICIFYGENFFVFRGNHWDYFYYLSQSILVNTHDYSELIKLNIISKNNFLPISGFRPYYFDREYLNIFYHDERPVVFLIFGSLLFFPFNNLFFATYILKIFLSALSVCSLNNILNYIIKKRTQNLIISIIFTFSFWNIYIHEIDALSQIIGMIFFIPLIFSSILIFQNRKIIAYDLSFYLIGLLIVSLYLVYLDGLFTALSFYLIVFLFKIKNIFKLFILNKNNIYIFLLLFIGIIFFSFQNILQPILETRIARFNDTIVNKISAYSFVWGYFGSFIMGKETILSDPYLVDYLRNLKNIDSISFLKEIVKVHFESKLNYFYLNFLPSISGLYFFGVPKSNNYFFLISFLTILFINCYLIKIFFSNIKYYFIKKDFFLDFFKVFVVFFLLMFSLFIYLEDIFIIIKIYTCFGFLIFIFYSIDFKKKSLNYFFLFLISIFFLYKFSVNNSGIGNYDSFPSIINETYKSKFNWSIIDQNYPECKKIENKIKDYDIDKLQWLKYNYINIKFFKYNYNNFTKYDCELIDGGDKFILLKYIE